MNMKKFLAHSLVLMAALSVAGCNGNKNGSEVIGIAGFEEKTMSEFDFSSFKSRTIELKSDLTSLENPVKVVFGNGRIYVLNDNMMSQNILVYSETGDFLKYLGANGRGPGEYLGISDFALDSEGNVLIADGVANKLIIYDNNLEYVSTTDFPFEIEGLAPVDGGYLVALALWDTTYPDAGVITVDPEMTLRSTVLPHLEYYDANYELSVAKFQKAEEGYFFNKSIDDNIYLLNPADGSLIGQYHFDFGAGTVPDEVRQNVEASMENGSFENYTMLFNFAVAGSSYACGNMVKNGLYMDFIADIQNGILYLKNVGEDMDQMFVGYAGNELISVILPQEENDFFKLRLTTFPLN